MTITPQRLRESLKRLPPADHYRVAYSGGRDSHVLLHLLTSLFADSPGPRLSAIHVNHGLQADAVAWMAHCVNVCRQLGLPCQTLELELSLVRGESPEAQARKARYRALKKTMEPGDMLLTAHHQEDQAETVLLQLLRGAGPAGLSAMPVCTGFGCGYLARPLLETGAADIRDYAGRAQLGWIEDPSNRLQQFDRNFLRNRIMPLLRGRWPGLARTIARSARHCAESQALIDVMAAQDLEAMGRGIGPTTLPLPELALLPPPRGRAVLRAWIKSGGFPLPGTARLDRVLGEMLTARRDRNPMVHWPGTEIRRYRDRLYIMPPLLPLDPDLSLDWDGTSPLPLPADAGRLEAVMGPGGIRLSRWRAGRVRVRFRTRRDRVRIAGRAHSTSFKKLYQQCGVPVWMRPRVPLVYLDDELAAVGDLCVCEPFAAVAPEQGVHIHWTR